LWRKQICLFVCFSNQELSLSLSSNSFFSPFLHLSLHPSFLFFFLWS
jgi:hypothetical protein